MSITIRLDRATCDLHRGVLMEWARANDLDPDDIPDDATIVITGDSLTVDVIRRDANGHVLVGVSGPHTVERTTKTVPYRQAWPLKPGVSRWRP